MNTHSIKLDSLIAEFPEESEAIRQFEGIFNESLQSGRARSEFEQSRLFSRTKPKSFLAFLSILSRLTRENCINFRKVYRLESSALGGIEDFQTLADIPNSIDDPFIGRHIQVELEQIKVFYLLEK